MIESGGRAILLALLLLCMPIAATGSAVATPIQSGDGVTSTGGPPFSLQNDSDEATDDNDTVRHRNPDEYTEDGDLDEVERWLADRLSERLHESTVELSQGEYETAKQYVGDDYRDRFDQYVDVAGETDGESQSESFEAARTEQERLADSVQEYRETKEEYDEAREAGDDERARELARTLETLAEETGNSSTDVRRHYDTLGNETGEDFTETEQTVDQINQEIQDEQAEVREEEFTETQLTIESQRETISFLDPFVASGELQTADGNPVANETIRLDIGNQTVRVETGPTGEFDLEYRPTDVPLTADELDIRFVPDNQSIYLGSETTAAVSLEQTQPTVTDLEVPAEVSYSDEVTVAGELAVDDVPVDDISLAVTLDGQRIGQVHVSNGSFSGDVRIPASVDDGEQELGVRWPFEERALASVTETDTVTVAETESRLSIEATRIDDRELQINGTLTTADGDGVAGQSVQLHLDGTTVGTITTDEDGAFGATVSIPASVGDELQVLAVFDGSGSNLEPAETETVIELAPGSEASSPIPTWVWFGLGLACVFAVLAGFRWYQRSSSSPQSSGDSPVRVDDTETAPQSQASPLLSQQLLSRASNQLSSGRPDAAVQTCYTAVRQALESRIDRSGALTHWEFYQQYRSRDDQSRDTAEENLLRDVTENYEYAAFGVEGVSDDRAKRVLDRARQLCGFDDGPASDQPADD